MMPQPTIALAYRRATASLLKFRDDERGSVALIMIFMFLIMMMFGGIAVDVMRYETRRVTLQQTLDRAALAAASLQQTRTPQQIVDDWYAKSGLLDDGLAFVDFSAPTITAQADAGLRRVTVKGTVFSQNFFMSWYSPRDYFETELLTQAAQGVSRIEVIMVLDITGSMGEALGGGKTKIEGLREAATSFVDIVKSNDTKNQVSIGMVPYAAQVNVPVNLRQQFNEIYVSSWNGVPNAGVPNINCVEFPTSSFTSTGYSLTDPLPMAAVADAASTSNTGNGYQTPAGPSNVPCTTGNGNLVVMPTKNGALLKSRIADLRAAGNTYIAVGMRWGTALIDEAARPIYTAIGDATVQGRPADNDDEETRKIIILMTDGEHVENRHVLDAYKSGPSPIWRGTDGNFAIQHTAGRPTDCAGWNIPASANRSYFLPHMKDDSERLRVNASEPEGRGTGALTTLTNSMCDPNSWVAAPTWPATHASNRDSFGERVVLTDPDGPDADTLPDVRMVTATRLDWSEVWRYVRVSWVVRQLYVRSGVAGTSNFDSLMNQFRAVYLTSTTNMDNLLQQNCAAARKPADEGGGGVEIYGIMFDDNPSARGKAAIYGCSSLPKATYYYEPKSASDLTAVFNQIATDISDLRLTQ